MATLPNLAEIRVADVAGGEEYQTWRNTLKRLRPAVRHTNWEKVPQY